MRDNYKQLEKQINKDITKRVQSVVSETAEEFTFQVQSAYESTIDSFYEHKAFKVFSGGYHLVNTPHYYKRTYSTYEASSMADSATGKYKVRNESSLEKWKGLRNIADDDLEVGDILAGILVSSKYIKGSPYKGYNGFKRKTYPVSKEWVFTRTYTQGIHGFRTITKKYNTRADDILGMASKIPLVMYPTPEMIMRGKFRQLKSRRNINGIINTNIQKYFS